MLKKLFLTASICFLTTNTLFALTGREIMEKTKEQAEPKSLKNYIVMTIHKKGKVLTKEFKTISKEFGEQTKSLVTFIKPSRMKMLTHTQKDRDDDQWLRLTSGKIKRITGSAKDDSFGKSHISYNDLQSRKLDDYDYKNLGTVTELGNKCYKIDAVKKDSPKEKIKNIYYVRETDFFIIRIDFYKKNKFIKYLENKDIKILKGITTPHEVIMNMVDNKNEKTFLITKKIKYNIRIKNSKFSKDGLRN